MSKNNLQKESYYLLYFNYSIHLINFFFVKKLFEDVDRISLLDYNIDFIDDPPSASTQPCLEQLQFVAFQ
jgi:hypothetical protein